MHGESVELGWPGSDRIARVERRDNLTVLLVDVSDSTRMYESLGDEVAFRQVRDCLDLFENAVGANGGRVVKALGDGLVCVFEQPADAVTAACEMQSGLRDRMFGRLRRIGIRIGFHAGPVLCEGNDIYGDTVKIATRMAQFAASGQIITTGDTVAQLAPPQQNMTRRLDAFPASGRAAELAVHEVSWQDGGETTQLPGRFEAVLAAAGIAHMRVEHAGRELAVVTSISMGRHESNDLVLKDAKASRLHARIERRNDKYVLIDLSANGTYVAMEGGGPIMLRREEMIMYGSGVITFGHAATDGGAEVVGFRVD